MSDGIDTPSTEPSRYPAMVDVIKSDALGGPLKSATKIVTGQDIANLNTNPIEILAGVPGYGILLYDAVVIYTSGQVAYIENVSLSIGVKGVNSSHTSAPMIVFSNVGLDQTDNIGVHEGVQSGNGNYDQSDLNGLPITFLANADPGGDGDGTFVICFSYMLIPITI